MLDKKRKLLPFYCFRAAVREHVHAGRPHVLHSSGSSCSSGPSQVVFSDLLRVEVEVELTSRVLGSKHRCLAQVDPSASFPQLRAEVYDGHHEGSDIVPRTR